MRFLKQASELLFPKVLWERPINKKAAKRLLIIGGHATQFSATQLAYQEAVAAGIGEAKVVLPNSVLKVTGPLPDCLFVASTPAGSIAKTALPEIESYIGENDGVLLAGELSQNNETVSVIESLLRNCKLPMILSPEVIENTLYLPSLLFTQPNRLLISSTQTYVKLAGKLNIAIRIQPRANLMNKIDLLKALMQEYKADYVLSGKDTIVYSNNQTSVTSTPQANTFGDGILATFWLQHTNKFEAITTAAYILSQIEKVEDIQTIISKH